MMLFCRMDLWCNRRIYCWLHCGWDSSCDCRSADVHWFLSEAPRRTGRWDKRGSLHKGRNCQLGWCWRYWLTCHLCTWNFCLVQRLVRWKFFFFFKAYGCFYLPVKTGVFLYPVTNIVTVNNNILDNISLQLFVFSRPIVCLFRPQ